MQQIQRYNLFISHSLLGAYITYKVHMGQKLCK